MDTSALLADLTYSDGRGLLNLSTRGHDIFHQWLFEVGMAVVAESELPEFNPAGWPTTEVESALRLLACLSRSAGRRLYRVRALARVLMDALLSELQDRGVIQ